VTQTDRLRALLDEWVRLARHWYTRAEQHRTDNGGPYTARETLYNYCIGHAERSLACAVQLARASGLLEEAPFEVRFAVAMEEERSRAVVEAGMREAARELERKTAS